jgi:pilus assembly protein CpaB
MKSRALWVLLAALIAGLAAVWLSTRWMRAQTSDVTRVVVARSDIPLGTRLEPQMLQLADWPRSSVPTGARDAVQALEGRVVLTALQRGEPITEARMAPQGARAGLSAVVPEGKRAMTVRVNDVVGVAGFALPGTYVDVLVNTVEDSGNGGAGRVARERSVSKIVLERILVLAAAQEADRDSTRPKVVSAVTLELTPAQAETLDLARSVGTLSLVLRNHADTEATTTRGATKAGLLAAVADAPAATVPVRASPSAAAPAKRAVAQAPAPPVRPSIPTVVVAPERPCVEIVAGPVRRTECF